MTEQNGSLNTATNWKNVNNWHWTEKNCLPWAKEYFSKKLIVNSTSAGLTVEVSKVSTVEGDVDLTQRKGKIRTLYDLKIDLQWKARNGSDEAKGSINIPEVAHDTDKDDFVFETCVKSTEGDIKEDSIKKIIKELITPQLISVFVNFQNDLIEAHMSDVYIESANDAAKENNKPKENPANNSFKGPNVGTKQNSKTTIGGTTTIEETIDLVTSPEDIYKVLTNEKLAGVWAGTSCKVDAKINGEYSLFDGNIQGKFLQLEPGNLIKQTWRLHKWPKEHFSTVTIEIQKHSSGITLKIKQEGVPIGEEEEMKENWEKYYWRTIKTRFGYGMVL